MVMVVEVPELQSAHMKRWRAHEHAQVLESQMARWLHGGGYRFVRTVGDEPGQQIVHIRFNELPKEWALLVGDCIQNLRNALDHLVYGLAELTVGRPLTEAEAKGCEFPVFGPQELTERKREQTIGLLPPTVQDFIVEMQPHVTGERYRMHVLWLLHEMSNRDKHRTISTALASMTGIMSRGPLTAWESAPPGPFVDGDWVCTYAAASDIPEESSGIVGGFQIVFGPDMALAGRSIVNVLDKLQSEIEGIIDHVLALSGYGFQPPWERSAFDDLAADRR